MDAVGDVFVADEGNNAVEEILADGSMKTIGSGFSHPMGVSVDAASDVFVADFGNNAVKEVLPDGTINTIGAGFVHPWDVAIDASGDVFVADYGNSAVKEVLNNGSIATLGSGFSGPTGVMLDGVGDVFVVDTGHSRVVELSPSTVAAVPLPVTGSSPTMVSGTLVALAPGTTYYYRVVAVSAGGTVADTTNPPQSFTTLTPPTVATKPAIAVSAEGATVNASVNPEGSTATSYFQYSTDPTFTPTAMRTVGPVFNQPDGVAVDAAGDVFVADTLNGAVKTILPNGTVQAVGPGFSDPVGLAVDAAGDTIVDDLGSNAIAYNLATISVPGAAATGAYGINNAGQIVGAYYDPGGNNFSGPFHGFSLNAGTFSTLDVPGATDTHAFGINDSGQIVGDDFVPGVGVTGFLLKNGVYTILQYNGYGTQAFGINDSGQIVGIYRAPDAYHGFLYSDGTYTTIDPPGSTQTDANAINNAGEVAGQYYDSAGRVHGFTWSGGTYNTVDAPGSTGTALRGINNVGQIDGNTVDFVQGFVASGGSFTNLNFAAKFWKINDAGQIIAEANGNGVLASPTNVKEVLPGGATEALGSGFSFPEAVAVDATGDLFVADTGNNAIKEVLSSGAIRTVGDGFNDPQGVAVDAAGDVFVADTGNNSVNEILSDGTVQTLGSGFNRPAGVAVDAIGDVYVADQGNNAVKEILSNGTILTLGSGFNSPRGLAVDAAGDVFVADTGNNRVVELSPPSIASTPATVNGSNATAVSATLTGLTPDTNYYYRAVASSAAGTVLAQTVEFTTAATSIALDGSGNLVITDIASGGKNNNLTLSYDATNSEYIITDPTAVFSTTVGTTNGQHEVDVPASDVTGKIEVNTGAGNDTLTVDYSGGTPLPAAGLAYDGGTGTLDQLIVTGYSGVPVVSDSTGAHSGTVQVGTGAPTISYTDLSPITLAGVASTLTLNLAGTGVANTNVLLGDDGGAGDPGGTQSAGFSAISGSTFEYTEFANPTKSLTVQLGNLGDTITAAKMDSRFAPAGPAAFVIYGGTGIDHFNIQATPAAGVVINGKGGADVVVVGSNAPTLGGTLADIAGALSIADTGGKAALTIDDSGDTGAKTAVGINKSTISNFAPAAINYTGTQISSITVDGGSGGNTFNFNTPAISNTFTVKAGTGDNTLKVNNATAAATDIWQVKGLNSGIEGKITFSAVAHLVGGAGPDVFKILAAGKVTSIDGGGAPAGQGNWLDYSVFKTPVNVNLATGAATNIGAGGAGDVANVQDVRGGSGNDTLSGDAQGNILVGGAGNDVLNGGSGVSLLIGGKGADTINGGSGGDLIIGDDTKYDTNNTALMAILAEWQSADSYGTRINDIENGGGLNKTYRLYYNTGNTGTVVDDKAADKLYGGTPSSNPDDDWFFQGVADTVYNLEAGETVSKA